MTELTNIILMNAGILILVMLAYFWGLATREVRDEKKERKKAKQNVERTYSSPALRRYYESR